LIPLIVIGLAEFGDKTQLSIFLLSSKTKKHLHLLLGVMFAFLIVDGAAVLIGSWIINIVPMRFIRTLSGIILIISGVSILRAKEVKGESRLYSRSSFLSGFALIFVTEWGDKTQIAAGILATKYNPLMVLTGAVTVLGLLSIVAVYFGRFISNKISRKVLTRIAGILFILMGISFFLL